MALDREGGWMSLEEFADFISGLGLQGKSEVNFIIGVTLGLSGDILKSTYRRCWSRSFKIARGEPKTNNAGCYPVVAD